ncbi:MAG TPA: FeoB-associated Cys-rich membrane protein [Patescibacteria group bacterium]
MENPKLIKRLSIIFVYLVIFSAVGFLLWYFITPPATCTDRKQNQSETGIDCGGPCSPCKARVQNKDIKVQETAFASGGSNTFDVVAKISNPNDSQGASSFDYTFTLKDAQEKTIATRQGTNFILPADTRYIAELGLDTGGLVPSSVDFSVSNYKWDTLGDLEKPQLNIFNKKLAPLPMGSGDEADGTVRNDSTYDLNKISIIIVLRDQQGKIIGINTTQQSTVRASEERDFRVTWPYDLSGNPQSMEVDAQANIFDPSAFSNDGYSGAQ